jgi:periplasmic protein TonB
VSKRAGSAILAVVFLVLLWIQLKRSSSPPAPPPQTTTAPNAPPSAETAPGHTGSNAPPPRVTKDLDAANAALIHRVDPVYPQLAKQARIRGVVRFRALLAADGSVQQLQLISGHPLLVQASIDAIKQWKYQPTLVNGQPAEVETEAAVVFALPPPK